MNKYRQYIIKLLYILYNTFILILLVYNKINFHINYIILKYLDCKEAIDFLVIYTINFALKFIKLILIIWILLVLTFYIIWIIQCFKNYISTYLNKNSA